jgi:hypothetical protein
LRFHDGPDAFLIAKRGDPRRMPLKEVVLWNMHSPHDLAIPARWSFSSGNDYFCATVPSFAI